MTIAISENINYELQITFSNNDFEILENGAVSPKNLLADKIFDLATNSMNYEFDLKNNLVYFN